MRKKISIGTQVWVRGTFYIGFAILIVLLLPILQVLTVKIVNPPITPLMIIRRIEAAFSGGRYHSRTLYQWVVWNKIPENFIKSVWISEDERFFRHHGFDWIEFHAAMATSELTGKPPRGTSTITMQCARSLFLWQGRNYIRKGLEAYYTFWMELCLSKRRILELYANVIEMGDGIYGIEAASQFYYHKPAILLSRSNAAMLAAMLPNPRRWNPKDPNQHLLRRQQRIMRELPTMHLPDSL